MCVIIHKQPGVTIPEDTLRKCWLSNFHGAGFMYSENKKLVIKKGYMKLKDFLIAYNESNPKDKEMIIHFRYATHGKIDEGGTHPYLVQNRIGVVHNGILSFSEFEGDELNDFEKGLVSDTSLFCTTILELLPPNFEENQGIIKLLDEYLILNRSIVVLMNNEGSIYILGETAYEYESTGLWFSNSQWNKDLIKELTVDEIDDRFIHSKWDD